MRAFSWISESRVEVSSEQPEPLDPIADLDWDQRLIGHPESTVFHSRGWARTLQATYGHKPCFFGFRDSKGIRAVQPMVEVKTWLTSRRGIALPFSDACPGLGGVDDLRSLLAHAVRIGKERGWKFVEFRGLPHELLGGESSLSFRSHVLNLDRPESAILGAFESSVRRAIRKAEGSELQLSISQDSQAMADYYTLHRLTRKRHGLFPQPYQFFANLHQNVIQNGGGFVTLARKNEQLVAGSVFLIAGRNACYKYGASDEQFQALRGNNLVMWRSIQECRQRKCVALDFGRTSVDNDGLRRFKLSYGTTEQDLHYLRLDLQRMSADRLVDRSSGHLNSVIRLLPLWAARLAGQILYPHAS